jgi:RND family efflux transporter MFP subunit
MIDSHQSRESKSSARIRFARKTLLALAIVFALIVPSMSRGQVARIATGPTPTMIYEGFTEPRHTIMVAATEVGRLESITVEVGDQVQAGQVIGKLEDLMQASSVRIAKLQTEMVGELEATRAEAELHRSRTGKLRQLAAEGMARPDELVRAETDLRIATGRLAAAQEQLELRKLELERFNLQLERRKIRAPMEGVISQVFHKPGEYITPADPSIVRLLVLDKLYAVFSVPVEDTAAIKLGSAVSIFLRSSAKTINASVSSIAPDIDGESGTIRIRVELDNRNGRLLAGDRCTLRFVSRTASNNSPHHAPAWGRRMR